MIVWLVVQFFFLGNQERGNVRSSIVFSHCPEHSWGSTENGSLNFILVVQYAFFSFFNLLSVFLVKKM